jgi:hypothetical protein
MAPGSDLHEAESDFIRLGDDIRSGNKRSTQSKAANELGVPRRVCWVKQVVKVIGRSIIKPASNHQSCIQNRCLNSTSEALKIHGRLAARACYGLE